MKALVCAVAAAVAVSQATAQPRYDRKLEEAVMAIVAAKMGNLRGGFDFGEKPIMVVVRDHVVTGTSDMDAVRPAPPPEGLARAVERVTGGHPIF